MDMSFLSAATSRIWNTPAISVRWLANPNRAHGYLPHKVWSSNEYLSIKKAKILVLIKRSYRSPKTCWLERLRSFWERNPASITHVPVLGSTPNHYHSNIGVQNPDYCCVGFILANLLWIGEYPLLHVNSWWIEVAMSNKESLLKDGDSCFDRE